MRPNVRPALLVVLATVLALGPSACGKSGGKKSGESSGTKPTVTVPSGNPPTALEKKDLIVGKGAEATAGKKVTVQYVGVSYSTKKEFDASWDRGQPFAFTLGQGDVIKGWDQGVPGMKVGGRRQLVIPPDLAYGARGAAPVIGPNETLVFVIDLVSVG
jgi:peptidylprolyl isomerase